MFTEKIKKVHDEREFLKHELSVLLQHMEDLKEARDVTRKTTLQRGGAMIREVMDQMSREAYALAIDLGITMQPTLGLSEADVPDSDEYAVGLLDVILTSYSRPGTKVAVLQDWLKGRRAEIDAFSGYIVSKNEELGKDVPVNRAVVEIARRVESGELKPSPENRELFLSALTA